MPVDPNNPYDNPTPSPNGPPQNYDPSLLTADGMPPSTSQLQQGVNQAFQNYQPQNGVAGGYGWDPTGGLGADGYAKTGYYNSHPQGGGQAPQQQGGYRGPTGDWDMSQPQLDEIYGGKIANELMSQDTLGRQWVEQNPLAFAQPGAGEQYWNQVAGNFNNRPVASNLAAGAYNNFESQRNELGELPGLDPYYDRARERTSADLNRQLAARGGYNTSRGLNILSDASQGLTAEQANREADYALKRSQDALNWAQGGSQAAQAADNSSYRSGMLDLSQTLGFGELSQGAQEAEQNRLLTDLGVNMGLDAQQFGRLGGALDASSVAARGRRDRIGQMFDDVFGLGTMTSATAGQNYQSMFNDLAELEDGIAAAELGGDAFQVGNEFNSRQEGQAGIGNLIELYKTIGGGMGG